MGTLADNVAQVKVDFKSVRDAVNYAIPEGTPTSEYGERIQREIMNLQYQADSAYTQGVEQGKQEVISNSKYIEKQASGSVIRLDDVSEVAHNVVVKADTPTEVKVYGKNLFNNDISLVKEVSYRDSEGNSSRKNGYEIHLPAGDYTATLISREDISNVFWYGVIGDANGNFVRNVSLNQSTANLTPLSFSINEGDVLYWYDGIAGRTLQGSWDKCLGLCQVQLEVGYVSTPYESYKEPQTITATPEGAEVLSICPTMTFLADNDVTVDYFGSYGMQAEYDKYWDNYQEYGKRTNYGYAFCQTGWTNANFLPKYDITLSSAAQMFYYSKITDLDGILKKQGIVMNASKATSVTYMYGYSSLTRIPITDLSSATNTTYLCSSDTGLVSIEKIISSEKTVFANNSFNNCTALEHCIFEGTIASNINLQWSKKLDRASILSLLTCLNATVSGIVITLPSMCIDGATDTLALIQGDTELNTAYTNALAKGYTISFV
jgi:hypothetical protein